ncbi:MAG: ROK family protein, partial [Planctomycetota bacterium]|nr:ROK family protein [Planctomycetota bacterium]
FITVSTGIGAGIIINNRLYRGQTGTAGEIGHTIIEPSSESLCTCGNNGCFMAQACIDYLVHRKRSKYPLSKIMADGKNSKMDKIDGKVIRECADQVDPLALEVINEYADYLGIMLYNIFQIFNPPIIIMGGGLMNWGNAFFERITNRFHSLARGMLFDPVAIVKAQLGKESGVIGAACLLLEE